MKCVISGGNIKILARAIQMLSKIGDEMFVQPQENSLSFRSVNNSSSSFVDVTFQENYFSYYAYEDLDESDTLKCKILIRSALVVFRTPSLIDKQVESCHIELNPNSENLCFILKYKNNIIKTHLLPILDCETLRANYKKDGTVNHLCIQPRVMNDVVQNFHQNLLEITIEVLQDKILIRNYVDENSNISNITRTQLVFGMGEFEEYAIDSNTAVTFCLKELRAIVHFAEALAQPIHMHFDNPGRPIVFVCKSAGVETNLVLATLNPDNYLESQSTASIQPNSALKKQSTKCINVKGKKVIKSLSKKSLSDISIALKGNNFSTNVTDIGNIKSLDKISNFFNSPIQNNYKRNMIASQTASPQLMASKSNASKVDHLNNLKQNTLLSIMKRKSDEEIYNFNHGDQDDLVQNSPPRPQSKKAKLIFQKCFQSSFNPRLLPGYDNIVVENSSESD